jgi:DNA-binding transcriptional regulator YdaS (Cro superfamily)
VNGPDAALWRALEIVGVGGSESARLIDVTPGCISNWRYGRRAFPDEHRQRFYAIARARWREIEQRLADDAWRAEADLATIRLHKADAAALRILLGGGQ